MVKVKICGLTRLDDVLTALEAGADYLGFIFYPPSPRAVTQASVFDLVRHLRLHDVFSRPKPPRLVGVFVNEEPVVIRSILDMCGLDLAQLSGNEAPDAIHNPSSPLRGRAYKSLRPQTLEEAERESNRYSVSNQHGPHLLIDTPKGMLFGGSGVTGDWTIAEKIAQDHSRLMLAGGLTPWNVAEAVLQVRPFAVDVASGVESTPGSKDPDLLRAFIANAKSVAH